MAFASIEEFLRMGGHAPFVWTCYGVTLAVLIGLVIVPLRRQRAFERVERQRLLRDADAEASATNAEQEAMR